MFQLFGAHRIASATSATALTPKMHLAMEGRISYDDAGVKSRSLGIVNLLAYRVRIVLETSVSNIPLDHR